MAGDNYFLQVGYRIASEQQGVGRGLEGMDKGVEGGPEKNFQGGGKKDEEAQGAVTEIQEAGKEVQGVGRRPEPPVSADWYHEGGEGGGQGVGDSLQQPKRMLGECETDFTQVARKTAKWD